MRLHTSHYLKVIEARNLHSDIREESCGSISHMVIKLMQLRNNKVKTLDPTYYLSICLLQKMCLDIESTEESYEVFSRLRYFNALTNTTLLW